ncbi:uncharacterized protein LOC135091225 [Scylla paramamosain]|uniref:uncharacterized protein LOC135091225 n=1 Tax=Scylla paramamosain TaxID=85552 RepID=UPI003082A7A9
MDGTSGHKKKPRARSIKRALISEDRNTKWASTSEGRHGDGSSSDEAQSPNKSKRRAKRLRTSSEHREHHSKSTGRKHAQEGHGSSDVLLETVRLMHAELPKLQAGSVKNYWTFQKQFQQFYLYSSASDTEKLNRLFTSCSKEVQDMIEHCMALPAGRGLKVALRILDERFGDERMYMNQTREAVMGGLTIGENDFQALSTLCGRLTSYISFTENLGKLHEVDNTPTMRDILLRLDEPCKLNGLPDGLGKEANAPNT